MHAEIFVKGPFALQKGGRLLLVVGALWLFSSGVLAQSGKSWLQRDAEIYASAWANKEASTVMLYTYPKLMEVYGDYGYRLDYIFSRMYGTITDVRIAVVKEGFRAGDDYISIVMMYITSEDQYYRYYQQIPLIASGYGDVKGYFFVQPDDTSDMDLYEVFPGFNRSMLPDYVRESKEQK